MQKYLFFLLILIFSFRCEKQEETVLARFDNEVIELPEFRQAFSEANIRIRDPKIAREKLLEEMIDLRILVAEAQERGIELGESEKLMIAAYRDHCLRQEFFRRKIAPQIQIDEALLEEVLGFRQMRRHLQYLIFVKPENAEKAWQALEQGASFEKLMQRDVSNSLLTKGGGDWGWIQWDNLEYKVAMPAFRLKEGAYSKPILANNWIYIVKAVALKPGTDFHLDPQARRKATEKLLKQKLGEQRQIDEVRRLMQDVKLRVRPNVLKVVSQKIQHFFEYRPAELKENLQAWKMLEAELWEIRQAPLFLINDSTFTVGQFLGSLSYTPVTLLQQNFKLVLDDVIRNYFLALHAKSLGLGPAIEKKVQMFADRKLVDLFEKKLQEKFIATDREIREKYNELQAQGKIHVPLEEARPLLRRQILQQEAHEEATRMARLIREKKDVYINYQLLHHFE